MKSVKLDRVVYFKQHIYGFIIIHIIDTSQVHVDFCQEGWKFTDSQKYTAYNNYISIFSPVFFLKYFFYCVCILLLFLFFSSVLFLAQLLYLLHLFLSLTHPSILYNHILI